MTDPSRIAALMLACREAACHERRQMADRSSSSDLRLSGG
jgi:hypothetical protein